MKIKMKRKQPYILLTAIPLLLTACGTADSGKTTFSDEAYGTVSLCDYRNQSAEKKSYAVTDEDIQSEIESLLYDYAQYKETEGPSKEGDTLSVVLTASKDGEPLLSYTGEDSYDIYLGSEEFGSEFDEKLTGVFVNDTLSFPITYQEDYESEDFAGSTIDYEVTVRGITEEILPDLTEDFIVTTLGYESERAMEEEIKETLEKENDANSSYELREQLIQQVIDGSDFKSYSQDLYDSYAAAVEENYGNYAEMFGFETVGEVYDLFGVTQEDVEKEILNYVYRSIAVHAICETEQLALTDEEYEKGLERYREENGYGTTEEMMKDFDEDTLFEWIQEDKVLDFLEAHAQITEIEGVSNTETDSDAGTF